MARLKEKYTKEIKSALQAKFNYPNPMMVPVLRKVVISMGLAEAAKDKNALQDALNELTWLSGQRPLVTRSRVAIAGFKLREDQVIGAKVTLHGNRMYDFADRFINLAAPRIRDFRGFKPKGDGRGSYSVGVEDQQIFAEIKLDLVKRTQGMNITFVTSAQTDEEALELLRLLGMPFKESA